MPLSIWNSSHESDYSSNFEAPLPVVAASNLEVQTYEFPKAAISSMNRVFRIWKDFISRRARAVVSFGRTIDLLVSFATFFRCLQATIRRITMIKSHFIVKRWLGVCVGVAEALDLESKDLSHRSNFCISLVVFSHTSTHLLHIKLIPHAIKLLVQGFHASSSDYIEKDNIKAYIFNQ
ncbi:uncharacterized protein BDR25DRAFT_355499 [Lindgomyces ingoldianus]|uniref:Uncharacterized protein n=1 Tax=Lindgomyces ingoldianus TaxID=673940 RepID=A0ACB6QTP0_9PLEO|nr:uncharacterized protein BDR25DRAFT_355499 [Lindgomyces ingoldianus]KAF2470388.1 hypothetical protein BDR25DRAFT_355499 [Lindgomyces ingoldianus]